MLLNVLAFVPLGWFLRKVTHFKWFSALSVIFLITLIFETLQYIFAIGASDINDILMNSLGGGIGLILFQLLKDKSKQKNREWFRNSALCFDVANSIASNCPSFRTLI